MQRPPRPELLAIPAYQAPPRTVDDWKGALAAQGHPPTIRRREGELYLVLADLGAEGLVVEEGNGLVAINFELAADDPAGCRAVLQAAAESIGWELHDDEEGGAEDDDDEGD